MNFWKTIHFHWPLWLMTNKGHEGQHIVWSQKSKFKLNKHILYFLHLELNLLEYPQPVRRWSGYPNMLLWYEDCNLDAFSHILANIFLYKCVCTVQFRSIVPAVSCSEIVFHQTTKEMAKYILLLFILATYAMMFANGKICWKPCTGQIITIAK